MKKGKNAAMKHSNSTWSLASWSTPLNKRKRKRSPDSPKTFPRRASLAESLSDINKVDAKGRSLLFYAARFDQPEVAVQLLAAGCNPDICDLDGNTALHEAAENGHLEVVKLLVQNADCSLDIVNCLGQTPLMRAVANDNTEICKLLIKSGCNKHALDHMNKSALLIGLQEGSEKSCLYLLKSGCDVNIMDREGHSAFYYAVNSPYLTTLNVAKKLLQSDYNIQKDAYWLENACEHKRCLLQTDTRFHRNVLSKAGIKLFNGTNSKRKTSDVLKSIRKVFSSSKSSSLSSSSSISSRTSSVSSDVNE